MRTILILLIALLGGPSALPAALLIDGFSGGTATDALGGQWRSFTDADSSQTLRFNATPGWQGARYCLSVSGKLVPGAAQGYAVVQAPLSASGAPVDIRGHEGLRFWARGSDGPWRVGIATTATAATYNHYEAAFLNRPRWTLVEVPFSRLSETWGPAHPWCPAGALFVQFSFGGAAPLAFKLQIGRVEFYDAGGELSGPPGVFVSPRPKADQVGYLSRDSKWFSVVTQTAGPGAPFTVVDASGDTAFRGTLGRAFDDRASSGEWVARGDFSGLTATGTYRVWAGGRASQPFRVGPAVYDRLWKDALRCFYLIRCGTAIDDPATGIVHAACHPTRRTDTRPGLDRDFTGGWHNAGDFGKWTHEAAFSVSHFLWLAEWRPDLAAHPPAGDPGLLNEARWGLDWLFKMQNPDGSVLHKVDSEPLFAQGHMPDTDPTTSLARYASTYSTIDAADFSAVMAQAARDFAATDPAYAARCASASARAWTWALAHPSQGQADPYYPDFVVWQEMLWAECERFRATRDPRLAADLLARLPEHPLTVETWSDPQLLGYFALAFDKGGGVSAALRAEARARLTAFADTLQAKQDASGYAVWLPADGYGWSSNSQVLGAGNVFCAAWRIRGLNRYRQDALRCMDNILGVNALDHCHATLFGTRGNRDPYHWANLSAGRLMPGWLSEGPNSGPNHGDVNLTGLDQVGTPPAKCFVDDGTSWGSDEGTTDLESAFVLLCGVFHSQVTPPMPPPPQRP